MLVSHFGLELLHPFLFLLFFVLLKDDLSFKVSVLLFHIIIVLDVSDMTLQAFVLIKGLDLTLLRFLLLTYYRLVPRGVNVLGVHPLLWVWVDISRVFWRSCMVLARNSSLACLLISGAVCLQFIQRGRLVPIYL